MGNGDVCISCRKPHAQHHCGLCGEPVCRSCESFVAEDAFSFLPTVAPELQLTHYCSFCHGEKIEPKLEEYREVLERARQVYFFFDTRKKPVPVLKRSRDAIEVARCADRDETILRLGFLAAFQGFNAVVDAEVVGDKVRNRAYQTTAWRGRGWPAQVDAEKFERLG
jgi:hypothetical protein